MPKINKILAYICADKDENDEGIPAVTTPSGMMFPLIGADEARLLSLRPEAQELANLIGKPLKIVRFTQMEVLGTVEPKKQG